MLVDPQDRKELEVVNIAAHFISSVIMHDYETNRSVILEIIQRYLSPREVDNKDYDEDSDK